jgi:hypothetical protein
MPDERRVIKRRKFGYYMRVVENNTHELVGYLSDISPQGFKLDCQKALTDDKDYSLRLDLTPEISDKPYISFVARRVWGQPDPIDPYVYNEGFQLKKISPYDQGIFQRILEKYGLPESHW